VLLYKSHIELLSFLYEKIHDFFDGGIVILVAYFIGFAEEVEEFGG